MFKIEEEQEPETNSDTDPVKNEIIWNDRVMIGQDTEK